MRAIGTALEQYNAGKEVEERLSNHNVIGFVDRYRTHRLKLCNEGAGPPRVILSPDPAASNSKLDPLSPLVVARVPPEILDGHDGFLYSPGTKKKNPFLTHFIGELYVKGQDRVTGDTCGDAKTLLPAKDPIGLE
jgi:hypothetical protein